LTTELLGRYGEVKILDTTGTQTPTPSVIHPVDSRYTDYGTVAPSSICSHYIHNFGMSYRYTVSGTKYYLSMVGINYEPLVSYWPVYFKIQKLYTAKLE
jgi:hypothetical protein